MSSALGNALTPPCVSPRSVSWARSFHWPITIRYSIRKLVYEVSHACLYLKLPLRHIHSAVTAEDTAEECSVLRLDYANSMLYGGSWKNVNHFQHIHNVLARCIVNLKLHHSSNALLQQLNWLCIRFRIRCILPSSRSLLVYLSAISSYLNSSFSHIHHARSAFKTLYLVAVPRSSLRAHFSYLHQLFLFTYLG